MIGLSKGPIPKSLAANSARWTSELLAEIARGGDAKAQRLNRYRQRDIKDALKAETHRKCAYCESKPLHVTQGDIEHIVPKAVDPKLAFDWVNLTLACSVCNNNKSDKEGFVDPYAVDPNTEFEFLGPMISHRLGRVAAERTKIELDLNRIDLLERRRDRIEGLMDKLERLHGATDHAAKALLVNTLVQHETSPDKEFAACVRAWVDDKRARGQL